MIYRIRILTAIAFTSKGRSWFQYQILEARVVSLRRWWRSKSGTDDCYFLIARVAWLTFSSRRRRSFATPFSSRFLAASSVKYDTEFSPAIDAKGATLLFLSTDSRRATARPMMRAYIPFISFINGRMILILSLQGFLDDALFDTRLMESGQADELLPPWVFLSWLIRSCLFDVAPMHGRLSFHFYSLQQLLHRRGLFSQVLARRWNELPFLRKDTSREEWETAEC